MFTDDMKTSRAEARSPRRLPRQRRSRETVEAVLDAVLRVAKREGAAAITTNRVAVAAGVSVGSLYQYFPDKHALVAALHDRHVARVERAIASCLVDQAEAPLEGFVRSLFDALVDAHEIEPELHEVLASHAGTGRPLEGKLRAAFRLAITSREKAHRTPRELEKALFVLSHMTEALCHGVAWERSPSLSRAAAREESVRAVLAYLAATEPRRTETRPR